MPTPDDPGPRRPLDRTAVRRGGLLGVALGALLLALALSFLICGFDAPEEVLGVFVPVTLALLSLALGTMALVPLRLGDTPERSPGVTARLLRLLAVLGFVLTALGFVGGEPPWTVGALAPLAAVAGLLVTAVRVEARAR